MLSLSLSISLLLLPLFTPFADAAPSPVPEHSGLDARLVNELVQRGPEGHKVLRQLIGGGDAYAPYQMPCPDGFTWIRPASGLSDGETAYLSQRQSYIQDAVPKMMAARNLTTPPRMPVIGLALSGGGLRAMQVNLGMVEATMNGSTEAAASGVGGWMDAVSYIAGLSGGSWGTSSFIANGGMLPTDLVNNVWDLESNLIFPDDDKTSFYYNLVSNVDAKDNKGFPTQITDYWGLALSMHALPPPYRVIGDNSSPNLTISQLPSVIPGLGNASLPMPIIIAAEREPGEIVIESNSTMYEFTPYEFGSWAFGNVTKVRGAFTPVEYLGSSLNNGQPNGTCWKGFDQLTYVMGTSATLFNQLLLQANQTEFPDVLREVLTSIGNSLGADELDVSRVPNPFAKWSSGEAENPNADFEYITLIDAGETNQNIPIEPLLVPARQVDAILALDSSADTTYSWPNGSALWTTYTRAKALAENQNVSIRMPAVPSTNGFVNAGLNTRPVFFGCNDTTTPVIVYVPSYPWSAYANTSTFQLSYDNATSFSVVTNGLRSLTLNASVASWPTCLACALTDRSFSYTAANRTATCQACFDTWCWNGVDESSDPAQGYAPVVGTVPQFLVDRNLSASPTGGEAAAATTMATGSAGRRWTSLGAGGLGMGVALGSVLAGGLAVVL